MTKFNYNKDQAARDKLLGISPGAKYGGGIEYFKNLDAATLSQMVEQGFADPESAQNCSPTVAEFLEFMEAHPDFKAHGYAVSLKRDDYRVSIEGLQGKNIKREDVDDFIQTFRFADDFEFEGANCYCWYD